VSKLLIVTGPPGAGKSTVASLLAGMSDRSVLVEGDAFFGFLAAGAIDPWLRESHDQNTVVTRAAALAVGEFVRGGYDTVYDGVVGPWFLSTFAASIGVDRFDYVILLPSAATCVQRVATRMDHGFTDEPATRQMHADFAAAEIDQRHVLVDPVGAPPEIASAVAAARRSGRLTHTARG
jgi:hypothetical protein